MKTVKHPEPKSRLATLNEDEAAELIATWLFDYAVKEADKRIKNKKAAGMEPQTAIS